MKKLYSQHKEILNELKRMMIEGDTIKYKEDGESKEMPADSAKKMSDDHPAKKAWLAKQGGDSDDSGEKVKGADLFKSKEGEPTAKSDSGEKAATPKDAYDAADEAVGNILSNLGSAPLSQLVSQNAAALKAYLNSGDPKAKTFIEDSIVDNNISIDDYKVKILNKELKANGIKHKVDYKSIEQRNYEPPKAVGKVSVPNDADDSFDSEDELDPEDILANAKAAYEAGTIDKEEWDDKREDYDDDGDYDDDKITYYWEDEQAKKDHEAATGAKQESVNESFLSDTAKRLLSRRIK